MSDIYDYAYAHVLHLRKEAYTQKRNTEETNTASIPPEEVRCYGSATEEYNAVYLRPEEEYSYGTTSEESTKIFLRPEEVNSYAPTVEDSNSLRPQEVNSYAPTIEDSKSETKVNTAYFYPQDVQTFVETLEAIARLEQVKVNDKPNTEEVYSYGTTINNSNSEFEVNTADFSPQDLQMFVDSLEAIARLEQAKKNGKPKRKVVKPTQTRRRIQVTCLDTSICESVYEDDVNGFRNLSWWSESEHIYDETCSGLPNCAQSTGLYSNLLSNTVPIISDSPESGVCVNNTLEEHSYENIEYLKAKSKFASYSKCKSLKSRLISLILKKLFVKSQKPTMEVTSPTTSGERILGDAIEQSIKSKKNKKKPSGNKPKENILSKVLRSLTL